MFATQTPRSRLVRCLPLSLVLLVVAAQVAGQEPKRLGDPRLLTIWRKQIHVFRERTLEHVGTVEIPRGWARRWWLDAAEGRLGVVSWEGLLKQKGPLQFTVLDLEARRVVSSAPIEGTLNFLIRASSGRVGFMSLVPAEKEKKGQPSSPPRIVRADLGSGGITATREIAGPPSAMALSHDGQELVLVFAGASGKMRSDRKPGMVEVLSAETLEPKGSLLLPGPADDVFWNGDRSRFYAEDLGIDDPRPDVALPGRLYVIEPKSGTLRADLELGIGPGPLGWDAERSVFYLLTRPRQAKGAEASLAVIRGDAIEKEIVLPARPTTVIPNRDRSRFFVLEEKGITVVDGALETIQARIPLPDTPTGVLPIDNTDRAYVTYAGSDEVASIDPGTGQELARFTTGRTSKKVGLAAAAALATGLSRVQSTLLTGNQYTMAKVVTVPSPETSGLLSPDGKLAFFYNTQTGDYTVVAVETNQMVGQIAGGGIQFTADGKLAIVMQFVDVVLWDLKEHRKIAEIHVGGGGKVICPDGDHIWAIAGIHSLNVFDIAKRAVVKKFDKLGGDLVFYDAAAHTVTQPD
jgi:DNA-binding beta-propeller fold protein YncE